MTAGSWVMLSNGGGFMAPREWSSTTFEGAIPASALARPNQLADVNGDGYADAVAFDGTATRVMLSTGSSFGPPTEWSNATFWGTYDPSATWLGDVNGDHRADAVAFDGTSTWVMLSNGSGFEGPQEWSTATFSGGAFADAGVSAEAGPHVPSGTLLLADANGDGRADGIAFAGDAT